MSEVSRRTAMFARPSLAQMELAVDAAAQARLADIRIDAVSPDPENPRRHFDEPALETLADSLRANGLLQPIIVRPGEGAAFILIAGERRWRAAKLAGFATIKAIIRPSLFDASKLLLAQVAENEAREDLTTADLVTAVGRLVALGVPKKEIASALATDPSRIARIHALANLPPDLTPLLDRMGIEPLYELFQQYKRGPEPVLQLLATEPVPARSAIRALGNRPNFDAGEAATATLARVSDPADEKLAPAQVDHALTPLSTTRQKPARALSLVPSASVEIVVRHDQHGEGRVVASPSIISDRLPVIFSDSDTPVQVLLGEINIVSIR